MTKPNIHINVRQSGNDTCLIDIQGEVTGFAESALMEAYSQTCQPGAKNIILNFTDLEYMNSSGIGLLVMLLIRAQRQQQKLMAFGLNSHYRQIFELTRLNEAIKIFESEADALSTIAAPGR